jgi:secretion/DNA translocation related TadE-like protein
VRRGERGSVTVVAASLLLVCGVLALACADVTKAILAASRAQTAADAAALAAAQAIVVPSGGDLESVAGAYADANGGALVSCQCDPGTTEAVVAVAVPAGPFLLLPGPQTVTRRARAVVGGAVPP